MMLAFFGFMIGIFSYGIGLIHGSRDSKKGINYKDRNDDNEMWILMENENIEPIDPLSVICTDFTSEELEGKTVVFKGIWKIDKGGDYERRKNWRRRKIIGNKPRRRKN
jgi:hypothetical protein